MSSRKANIIVIIVVVLVVVAATAAGFFFWRAEQEQPLPESTETGGATSSEYDGRTGESPDFTNSSGFEDPGQEQEPSDYDDSQYSDEFELAGINPADSYETVIQVHDMPQNQRLTSEKSIHNPDYISYWTYWDYDGLEVLFMKVEEDGKQLSKDIGKVFAIRVVSEDYTTHRGIKVGDTVSKALERYAQEYDGAYFSQDADQLFFEDGLNCIRFSVKDERISEILASQMLN